MSGWKARRFWKLASVEPDGAGWTVRLDGRPVKTPAKTALILPTRAMADAVAGEWDAQQGEIRPATMPVTRAANSAIDTVARQKAAVVAMIAAYGETDLLCYRAQDPAELVSRQALSWDPLLAWADSTLGARLAVTTGVIPVPQDKGALSRLDAAVAAFDAFELAALHDLVAISGSLVIGLAVAHGRIDVEAAWAASRIDETWQAEQWGEDAEAAETEAIKRKSMHEAARFLALARAA